MSDKEKLLNFERQIDEKIKKSKVLQLPLRSVLAALYGIVDSLMQSHNKKFDGREKGEALLRRLSYLIPIFENCTLDIGESAKDCLSVFQEDHLKDLEELVSYAHFCELMPEVHREYYDVCKTLDGFLLKHISSDFCCSEEKDIILTELSLSLILGFSSTQYEEVFDNPFYLELGSMIFRLKQNYDYYVSNVIETPLIESDMLYPSLGFSWEDFCKVRSILLAFSDYCVSRANTLFSLIKEEKNMIKKQELEKEYLEWGLVSFKENFFMGILIAITNIKEEKIKKILNYFSLDLDVKNFSAFGDGFSPSLIKYTDFFLFSPHALRSNLILRNILYIANKQNPETFHNYISKYLEPTLLKQSIDLLKKISGLIIKTNQNWDKGEFDLLAYQPDSNTVLHIQAKASLSPQGARMTRAVEQRAIEGIDQLKRFHNLPQSQKDSILSKIFNQEIKDFKCVNILLSRSGIGTYSAWKLVDNIVVLNIQLLKGVIKSLLFDKKDLSEFELVSISLFKNICSRGIQGWSTGSILLDGTTIEMPLLQLNDSELLKIKLELEN